MYQIIWYDKRKADFNLAVLENSTESPLQDKAAGMPL